MWCSQVWREINPQIIRNSWRMYKILLAHRSANFSIYDECEKLRMKEASNELTSLISSLNLGSEESVLKNMYNWKEKQLLMQSTTWLSWWLLHGVENSIWVQICMKSQWRGMMWMINQHQKSSFLKLMSMLDYYHILSGVSFGVLNYRCDEHTIFYE